MEQKEQKETIKNLYNVRSIPSSYAKGWCLKKHYAKRVPTIIHAYGLYNLTGLLIGICTFGPGVNYKESEAWKPFKVLELNRLIVDDGFPKNTTSFFVGRCLKQIPRPKVIISYADLGWGHYGYIYQATNWVFTGITGGGQTVYIARDGRELHQRYGKKYKQQEDIVDTKKTSQKARYYYFCADKRMKKEMLKKLRFPILPYPKGDSDRYDSKYKPSPMQLF